MGRVPSLTASSYNPSIGEGTKFEGTFRYIFNSGHPGPTVRPCLKEKKEDFSRDVEKYEE